MSPSPQHGRGILTALLFLPALLFADYRFPIGEQAVYKIKWGPITCGTSTITCNSIEQNGKTFIRIRIRAKSNWLVSTVYPVDDTVDCYIDPATQRSVRLEKRTSEGGYVCQDVLTFDRDNGTAKWDSQSQNISTNYPISADACDAVSFLYAFRRFPFAENQSLDFNLAVDTTQHRLTITAEGTAEKRIGDGPKVRCRKFIAVPHRDDLFVRKIPDAIWITDDSRKILARMDIKVPAGKVRVVLEDYQAPTN